MKETHQKIVEKGPKIEGIKSEKDASKALEAVEISFRDLIKELEAKSEKVEGLLKDQGSRIVVIIERIDKVMCKKMDGEKLEMDDRKCLVDIMREILTFTDLFRNCLYTMVPGE